MDYQELLSKQRTRWNEAKANLTKEELRFIAGKDSWANRRLNMFSLSYFRREKLVEESDVLFAYVFKALEIGEDAAHFYPTWMLFSPEAFYNDHPENLAALLTKVQAATAAPKKGGKRDSLEIAMNEKLAEAAYLRIPDALTDGHTAYLSIVYCRRSTMPSLRLGPNFVLAAPKVSKEILFLPQTYWIEEWKAHNETKEES